MKTKADNKTKDKYNRRIVTMVFVQSSTTMIGYKTTEGMKKNMTKDKLRTISNTNS